ncbi:C40 family peptidase [Desertivirga arenae]|uniref:C40 family peptidase n=1 Tax=Desertivirga arenae TaxID=2810309 RepID=UPI001F60C337|nr:NlpC/P60 family protein [Pedobacter sp. SYSU D00823]
MKCNWSFLRGGAVLLVLLMALASCKSKKMLTDSSKDRGKQFKGSLKERYAALLDVSQREIKNEKLYRFIDDWMGVPYRNGGMDKKGVDCSGFVVLLEKEIFDKSVPRIAKSMADNVKRKYEEELEEGDLVFFDFSGQKFSHVGVYLKNNRFVHASSSKGVIISNLKDGWYYKYFSRCGSAKNNYYSVLPVDSLINTGLSSLASR